MNDKETIEEVKDRMVERLGWLIINPGAGVRTEEDTMLTIRSSLTRQSFRIARNYINHHISENEVSSIAELEIGPEKGEKFDELCDSIFLRIRALIRNTEANANSGEEWYSKITIENFLRYPES